MIPTHDNLSLAVFLYRRSSYSLNADGNWEGILPEDMSFTEVMDALDRYDMRGMICDEQSRKFDFAAPPSRFFISIEEFLQSPNRRVSIPDGFYIADLDYCHPTDEKCPEVIKNYILTVRFFEMVGKNFADDIRPLGGDKTLVFLSDRKLEITSEFCEKDLIGAPRLDDFIQDFVTSNVHTQQKRTIFNSVLFNIFDRKTEVKFSDLLAITDSLIEQVNASYQLYVSEFSFQKVKAEVEREKLEFTTRLNKIFSDIQNQLLAIPAAMILVGGQMKQVNAFSLSNILIWLGSLVFSILMLLLIRNQRNTLAAIKNEIDHQWELIGGSHQAVSGLFEKSYTFIANRHTHQQTLLTIVSGLVILGLILSTVLLAWYSGVELDSWLSKASACIQSIVEALRL